MKINEIYLDLDDVLNRLTMYTLFSVGLNVDYNSYDGYPTKFGYNILGAAKHLAGGEWNPALGTFWDMISRKIWAECPKSELCDWLIAISVDLVGEDNVFIASSPTKDPDCLAGKLEWIHNNLPKFLHRQYFITPRKVQLAHPGALLIDDSDSNVLGWRERGGSAIIVPRPWNCFNEYTNDAESFIHNTLEFVFEKDIDVSEILNDSIALSV